MVYCFGPAKEKLAHTYAHIELDGDSDKIKVIDQTLDGGTGFDLHWNKGRAITAQYFPTKVIKKGPVRRIPDMDNLNSYMSVSQKYKDLVEKFEPGVHQFSPVEVYWDKNEPPVGTYYFFNICNRLDTTDKEKTTWRWSSGAGGSAWMPTDTRQKAIVGLELVFRKGANGNAAIWCDKYLSDANICSDAFHDATVAAGCSGIEYIHCEEV